MHCIESAKLKQISKPEKNGWLMVSHGKNRLSKGVVPDKLAVALSRL